MITIVWEGHPHTVSDFQPALGERERIAPGFHESDISAYAEG